MQSAASWLQPSDRAYYRKSGPGNLRVGGGLPYQLAHRWQSGRSAGVKAHSRIIGSLGCCFRGTEHAWRCRARSFERIGTSYLEHARAVRDTIGHAVVAGHNYGQGNHASTRWWRTQPRLPGGAGQRAFPEPVDRTSQLGGAAVGLRGRQPIIGAGTGRGSSPRWPAPSADGEKVWCSRFNGKKRSQPLFVDTPTAQVVLAGGLINWRPQRWRRPDDRGTRAVRSSSGEMSDLMPCTHVLTDRCSDGVRSYEVGRAAVRQAGASR